MIVKDLLQLRTELSKILTEELPIHVKFRLSRLQKSVEEQSAIVFENRNKIIFDLEPSGHIPATDKDGNPNEKLNQFNEMYGKILEEDVNIGEIPKVFISDITNFNTGNNYPMLFELVFYDIEKEPALTTQ